MLRLARLCASIGWGSVEDFDVVDGEPQIGEPVPSMEGRPDEKFAAVQRTFDAIETGHIHFLKVEKGVPTLLVEEVRGDGYTAKTTIRI